MLGTLLFWTLPISTVLHVVKNNAADNNIKRSGLIITSDERSISEQVISFLKEYAYLVVPVYNVVKSFKKFIKSDSEYKNERLTKLREYERIQEKPILTKKKDFQDEKSKEIKKELPKKEESNKPSVVKSLPKLNLNKKEKSSVSDIFDMYIDSIEHLVDSIAPFAKRRLILKRKSELSESDKLEIKNSENVIKFANTQIDSLFKNLSSYINDCSNLDELKTNLDKYSSLKSTLREKHTKIKSLDENDPELNIIVRKYKSYDNVVVALRNRISILSKQSSRTIK